MKQKLWWLLIIVPFILALFFLIKNQIEKAELERTSSKLVFNSMTQKWEKYIKEDPIKRDREANTERIAKAAKQLLLTL